MIPFSYIDSFLPRRLNSQVCSLLRFLNLNPLILCYRSNQRPRILYLVVQGQKAHRWIEGACLHLGWIISVSFVVLPLRKPHSAFLNLFEQGFSQLTMILGGSETYLYQHHEAEISNRKKMPMLWKGFETSRNHLITLQRPAFQFHLWV